MIPEYRQRGWSIIPIAHKSKNPSRPGWQSITFTPADFPQDGPMNVGIHLGERSGWLVDIDLDHAHAVDLAPDILPPTPAVFGRASKPRSHHLYYVTAPIDSKPYKSKDAGTIVEIRASGQTVFPPSTHPSGEPIEWHGIVRDSANVPTPAKIDPADLREAVETVHRAALAWLAMEKISIADGKDGSRRLHTCACRCVEHDLPDNVALLTTRHYAVDNPFPRDWSDDEILQRLRDAEGNPKVARGSATGPQKQKLSTVPPEFVAAELVKQNFTIKGCRTLHSIGGDLLRWTGDHYIRETPPDTRNFVRRALCDKFSHHSINAVAGVIDALKAEVALPSTFGVPGWIDGKDIANTFPCRSGLVDLATGQIAPASPDYVNTVVSPVVWSPDGPPPTEWLRFLDSVWPDDPESVRLLQQWVGYLLTPDTRQQKILLIIGPKRSGKGTIGRVLRELLGPDSVAGPTLASLSQRFGLQPLLDKTLAVISDARLSGKSDGSVIVERLLSISGEDALTVDRKFTDPITRKLTARLMMMTNETPRLADTSGALANRFLILRMNKSFLGREDVDLTDKLLGELPGILQWAAAGWRDLRECRRFSLPRSSATLVREMEELGSPITKFIRQHCLVDPSAEVEKQTLYQAYANWCQGIEHIRPPSFSSFGKQLRAAVMSLADGRPRDSSGTRRTTYVGIKLLTSDLY